MKVMSTTGALLFEKNIGYDINPESGMIEDQIVSIVSSPNPEDMHVSLLTQQGKIFKYAIRLEKLVDPSLVVEEEVNETNSTLKKKPK